MVVVRVKSVVDSFFGKKKCTVVPVVSGRHSGERPAVRTCQKSRVRNLNAFGIPAASVSRHLLAMKWTECFHARSVDVD